jgi:hypothetical protein
VHHRLREHFLASVPRRQRGAQFRPKPLEILRGLAEHHCRPRRQPMPQAIAFPTAVLGPVLLKALWRLAAIWAGVAMAFLSRQPMRGIRFKGRTELSYPLGVQAA